MGLETKVNSLSASQAQYLALSAALSEFTGRAFEAHRHPAVLLDRATGPSTRVWGWWAETDPPLPCLLWSGEHGWSATVVEPDDLDSEGYERDFWAHRIKLLDIALANALGPYPTLEDLELRVNGAASFGIGNRDDATRHAMRWGVLQLRAARARFGTPLANPDQCTVAGSGTVDEELARHALLPTLPKPRSLLRLKRDDASTRDRQGAHTSQRHLCGNDSRES